MKLNSNPAPPAPLSHFDTFHFGLFVCASCLEGVRGDEARVSHYLDQPFYVGRDGTEIRIPGGRQSFHVGCLSRFLGEGRVAVPEAA